MIQTFMIYYNMKYILFLFFHALAGTYCLPNGWVLDWFFTPDDLITFKLTLTQTTLDKFQWVAVGFKYPTDTIINTDIVKMNIQDKPIDMYAQCDCAPEADVDLNGKDNIVDPTWDAELMQYTWAKPVSSEEEYDKFYKKDSDMVLIYASGKVINGIMMKHMVPDRGRVTLTLSDDFIGACAYSLS